MYPVYRYTGLGLYPVYRYTRVGFYPVYRYTGVGLYPVYSIQGYVCILYIVYRAMYVFLSIFIAV